MSRERSASAITSLPKPGALAPAGVGRSRPATAGSAALVLARAVADWDGVMAGISSAVGVLAAGWAASNRITSRYATGRDSRRRHSEIREYAARAVAARLQSLCWRERVRVAVKDYCSPNGQKLVLRKLGG